MVSVWWLQAAFTAAVLLSRSHGWGELEEEGFCSADGKDCKNGSPVLFSAGEALKVQ